MITIQKMVEEIHEGSFSFLNLHYTDLFGDLHTITVPTGEISPEELFRGIPFDSSSIPGFNRAVSGDMALLPQADTLFTDGFGENDDSAGVLCNIIEPDSGNIVDRNPRTILERAESLVKKELGAQSFWLPELEFFVFNGVLYYFDDMGAAYKFSLDEIMQLDERNMMIPHLDRKGGYHAAAPADRGYEFRSTLTDILEENKINVRYHHHEVSVGQQEIELMPCPALKAADSILLSKYLARKLAAVMDVAVTFMPKPLHNFPGSGLHFHQWLVKKGESLFWDENAEYSHLSEIAINYVGGLLTHAPALTALTNPSTNSFKRLVLGFEAPTKLFFGVGNRSAAVRIPKYVDRPQSKRIEYRPPDSTCNPYLAIAGMLLAGLDGIRNKIGSSEVDFGPYDEDIARWDSERKDELKSLPENLSDAVNALYADHEFLVSDGVFPKDMIETYGNKLIDDERELLSHPTPYEVAKYFGI